MVRGLLRCRDGALPRLKVVECLARSVDKNIILILNTYKSYFYNYIIMINIKAEIVLLLSLPPARAGGAQAGCFFVFTITDPRKSVMNPCKSV
ncbi:hypothetical protein A2Y83_03430 [Candidatus Falkowbacteria bacterium RBG_13_39_14]|uniref:Uncharacterized protein n=1 Tax=Candidatus Falkowbacteria bacterium RBG_13_39_14 TaxID=1797985 RepID=A0A1F5S154_9BACT|nr:MAG: hypothetical protein A2Y83_03430 [Candidatus Falkowbacteria bacterium RBG_13_39_14]